MLEQKNKFCVGDVLEVVKPSGENVPIKVLSITDDEAATAWNHAHIQSRFSMWNLTVSFQSWILSEIM